MGKTVEELRGIWRRNFRLPSLSGTRKRLLWFRFAFYWLWSLVGVIPGALAAAFIVGASHITETGAESPRL